VTATGTESAANPSADPLPEAAAAGGYGASAPTQRARRRRFAEAGFVVPLALLILLAFDAPILLTLGWSFRDATTRLPTLENYAEFFESSLYARVIARTFYIAAIVTIATAVLGYPLAYWMARLSSGAQLLALCLVVIPFWVSILVRTYAWIVILGNGGIVNRWLTDLGFIERPISFLYNEFGVTLGMVNVLLPFLVLPLYAAMVRIDPRLTQVAETLGASRWQAFVNVFLPLSLPALAASMILVFILSIGFYITPAILGGGKVPMVANMMDLLINRFPRWEMASTISVALLIATLILFWMYQWLRKRMTS